LESAQVLPQAVTTGWCTELGTTLVFGFDSTIEGSAYFRYLCAYQSATESPHEPSSSPGWTRATRALSLWGDLYQIRTAESHPVFATPTVYTRPGSYGRFAWIVV